GQGKRKRFQQNNRIKMGLFDKAEPESYEIKGRRVQCNHCGNDLFWV
ncbi:MAG: hypothetical protein AVDCRST_MAG56-3617, partial [uncultured Cytophagales bacterium]